MAKKDKPTPEYDSKREQTVLLEEMNKGIKAIAEQHGSIKQEMVSIKNTMEQRFNRVEMAITELGVRFKQNDSKIDTIVVKVDKIEQKIDIVTTDHEKRIKKLELV